jgi:hypothetical protein
MRSNSRELRPTTERFSICAAVSTPSRAPVSVWITSLVAVTVTVSACCPTSSRTSMPRVSCGLMAIAFCS